MHYSKALFFAVCSLCSVYFPLPQLKWLLPQNMIKLRIQLNLAPLINWSQTEWQYLKLSVFDLVVTDNEQWIQWVILFLPLLFSGLPYKDIFTVIITVKCSQLFRIFSQCLPRIETTLIKVEWTGKNIILWTEKNITLWSCCTIVCEG